MQRRVHVLVLALACATSLAGAPSALAHAQLASTSPQPGATVATTPPAVIFKFNQNVGGTLGAVRVYDAQGDQVDDLDVTHPDGHQRWIGVGLEPNLPDGTYTATYRVVSADTHIVYGGIVFNIGHAGAAPRVTVAGLIAHERSGQVTEIAFGVVRGLDYLAIALMLGGLAFLVAAWLPGFTAVAAGGRDWQAARAAFAMRLRRLLGAAVALGLATSVLGILLQGASAAGVSLWASLKGTIVDDTLDGRFGRVWGARAIDWLVLGGLLALTTRLSRRPSSRRAPQSHPPQSHPPRSPTPQSHPPQSYTPQSHTPTWLAAPIAVCAGYLAVTPALAGHASVQSPTGVFAPADVLHVLAASVWVGGIACLLAAVPAATRQLERSDRSRLLLALLARFSPLALSAVIAIAATGVVQAYIDVRSMHALLHSTYGALVVVKTALLVALIGLGWVNRERVIPALRRIVGAGQAPGGVGVRARTTLRTELALALVVFGVTAALVSYTPPIDAASGPYSASGRLGAAELEITLEPAEVGANTIHLYLIEAATGAQFTATRELTVTARLPSKGIGPLPLKANLAGPGHYVLDSAVLSPAGEWQLQITDRVSAFDEYSHTFDVSIR
jgi:copper transport protein